jgi:hypothetical protein
MSNLLACVLIGAASLQVSAASPELLSRYRDVMLGDSLETVVQRLQVAATDVKVLHAAPSLVEEITWKPHRFVSGSTVTADPLAELVLTFHVGRLARIVAIYDRERTAGLTDADLDELLSDAYGMALLRTTPAPSSPEMSPEVRSLTAGRRTISTWADDATTVILWREEYPQRVGLTITSTAADGVLQAAIVSGSALTATNAPQRARDKQATDAAAAKERAAQIRTQNKARFKP